LISIAIALPVSLFLVTSFEIANDAGTPDSLLTWAGVARMLFGRAANRRWHYCRDKQPARFVRWYARCRDKAAVHTAVNLVYSAVAYVTGGQTPWALEAQHAAHHAADTGCSDDDGEHEKHHQGAKHLRRLKRTYAAAGVLGVSVTWALFAWCVPALFTSPATRGGQQPF
jgi:hypothetical protein